MADPFNNCSRLIRLSNFDVGHCVGINDDYRLINNKDTREWNESPWNCEWTDERRAYISVRSPRKCIWWEKEYRHWWVGDCGKRGNNYGSAFLEPDELCPHHSSIGDWKKSGTNENLGNAKIIEVMPGDERFHNDLLLGMKFY